LKIWVDLHFFKIENVYKYWHNGRIYTGKLIKVGCTKKKL